MEVSQLTHKKFIKEEDKIIFNIDKATSFFGEFLKSLKEIWISVEAKNQDRHRFIKVFSNNNLKSYYLLFKEEPFYSFDKQFEDSDNEINGFGESINQEWLKYAISRACSKIVVIYPNGFIYCLEPMIWLKYAESKGLIRFTDKETDQLINNNLIKTSEKTYSIPLRLLHRLN